MTSAPDLAARLERAERERSQALRVADRLQAEIEIQRTDLQNHIAKLRLTAAKHAQDAEALRSELEQAQHTLNGVLASRSWRLTGVVRSAAERLRGA